MSKGVPSYLSDRRKLPPIAIPLTDRDSANSQISGQASRKSVAKRIRKRSPFSEGCRNNFPNLDDVFRTTPTECQSGLVGGENDSSHRYRNSLDQSDDDLSDIGGSSVLNMSIGARAALNEHARYIAKYGIDGEKNVTGEDDNNNNNNNNNSDEICSRADTNSLMDHQWERLLDLSQIHPSIGSSDSGEIPSPQTLIKTNSNFDVLNLSGERSTRYEASSSVEVMTDVSHDYFNSSRVNLLVTPERNKNLGMRMIMTRDGEGVDTDRSDNQVGLQFGDLGSNATCSNDENDKSESDFVRSRILRQGRAVGTDPPETSLNLSDLSRISNTTVSDMNRTPNESFQDYRTHGRKENDCDQDTNCPFTPNVEEDAPSSVVMNRSSFSSFLGLRDTSQSSCDNYENRSPKNPLSTSFENKNHGHVKGNETNGSSRSSSSIQSTVSHFIAEARTRAKQVVSDVEKSIGTMEALQSDFLRSLEIGRADAPSPISQVLSTPSSSRLDSTKKEIRHHHFDNALNADDRNSIYTKESNSNNISSLSSSISVEDRRQMHLTGRQRYRTVVPRRVYLNSSAEHFAEEQDSFIAVQSNPEISSGQRCLLESFEEVATMKTF